MDVPGIAVAAILVSDGQAISAAIALYGVAVAFTGRVILHLVERNNRLETKVDGLHAEMNALHAEVRQLTHKAIQTLDRIAKIEEHERDEDERYVNR